MIDWVLFRPQQSRTRTYSDPSNPSTHAHHSLEQDRLMDVPAVKPQEQYPWQAEYWEDALDRLEYEEALLNCPQPNSQREAVF